MTMHNFSFSVYVHTYVATYLVSFLLSICVRWLACIAMPCLDIDTSRRVVFECTGYSVSQIKKEN